MILIGSARNDENGNITGGKPGDQKQKVATNDMTGEVSMQKFYIHKKGWYVLRAKSVDIANKIAQKMIDACNNSNIGYNQNDRFGVLKYGINTNTKTNCDCSTLVRECIKEASGKDIGNFTTYNESTILENSGLFDKKIAYTSNTTLYTGDVLVTKTKGHTAIVVYGSNRKTQSSETTNIISNSTVRKHKVGETVTYNSYFNSSTDGLSAIKKCSSKVGKITKVLSTNVNNPYLIENGRCWINDDCIIGATSTENIEKTKITYMSHCINNNSWCGEITGYNNTNSNGYSGIIGKSIDKLAIKVSTGLIQYSVHTVNSKWLSDVTGYSKTDSSKYAGITGKSIDGIAIKTSNVNGTLKYRVHLKDSNKWLSWVTGYSKTDSSKYAGILGKEIDGIQLSIE